MGNKYKIFYSLLLKVGVRGSVVMWVKIRGEGGMAMSCCWAVWRDLTTEIIWIISIGLLGPFWSVELVLWFFSDHVVGHDQNQDNGSDSCAVLVDLVLHQ